MKNFTFHYFWLILFIIGGLSLSFCNTRTLAETVSISATVEEFPIQETASVVIEPDQGGETELITETGATASVFFPFEATAASAAVSISSVNETDIVSYAPVPTNLDPVSDLVYDFKAISNGAEITAFDQPLTLTFSYTNAQITGLTESGFRVYYWDIARQEWIICSNYTLNTANNTITATVNHFTLFAVMALVPVCGDGAVDSGEQCDGAALGGLTCVGLGYVSGTLTCNSNCTFNVSNCSSGGGDGGGGGGGGGSYVVQQPATSAIFTGRAYPKRTVTLLKDAQIVATTIAGSDANFKIKLTGLSAGNYIFSLYSEDNKGARSSLLTFPVSITKGATTKVSGAFIAPTIDVDKSEVKRGENIAIFGQSAPKSEIMIQVSSDEEFFAKLQADKHGIYLYNFDTSQIEMGQHFTKSKSTLNGEISSFGKAVSFKVGAKTIVKETREVVKGDTNSDNKVNLIDFSIMAYWHKRLSPPVTVDLNNDNKVDLVDFSIMAYHWTG